MLTIGDILGDRVAAVIRCAYTNEVVRRLAVIGDRVEMHCASGEVASVTRDTVLRYESWFMDRGSLVFQHEGLIAKLCTEGDRIEFPDSEECGYIDQHGLVV